MKGNYVEPLSGTFFNKETHDQSITKKLDFQKYKQIISVWNYVVQAVILTRAYNEGLNAGLLLLNITEEYRVMMSQKEYKKNSILIYFFILNMLDRLDRWEDYLQLWTQIYNNVKFALTYTKRSKETHGERFIPFILGEDEHYIYVHFLWTMLHRKEVIERKLEKKKTGDKLSKTLFHAKQEELTEAEIQRRLNWIARITDEEIKRQMSK